MDKFDPGDACQVSLDEVGVRGQESSPRARRVGGSIGARHYVMSFVFALSILSTVYSIVVSSPNWAAMSAALIQVDSAIAKSHLRAASSRDASRFNLERVPMHDGSSTSRRDGRSGPTESTPTKGRHTTADGGDSATPTAAVATATPGNRRGGRGVEADSSRLAQTDVKVVRTRLETQVDASLEAGSSLVEAPRPGMPTVGDATMTLLPQHRENLQSSSITEEVVSARRYRSIDRRSELEQLGFGRSQANPPALLIPIWGVDGRLVNYQIRPDSPRIVDGRPSKYELPRGSVMRIDVPPTIRDQLADPGVRLFITEGVKKADSAVSRGLCCIDLLGVWGWRGRNDANGLTALADWDSIALNGRGVSIVFDSDVMTKRSVHDALERLSAFLHGRGAQVQFVYLPAGTNGEKVGLDDFFAAGGSVQDLDGFTENNLRPATEGHDAEYTATDGGMFWVPRGRAGGQSVYLANFSAKIVGESVIDDGVLETRLFDIEATVLGVSYQFSIPAGEFDALRWVPERLGAQADISPEVGRRIRVPSAIRQLSGDMPRSHRFGHTGWRRAGDAWIYLHAGGAIGPHGPVRDTEVAVAGALAPFTLPEPPHAGDLREAVRASLRLLEIGRLETLLPVFASIWRAALGDPMFSVFIYGPSGSFKSELAALAQQHFGAGMDARHLPGNWTSTANSLETQLNLVGDAIFVIDDFAPQGTINDAMRQQGAADRLLRAAGNRSGRGRLSRDAELRAGRPPRALALITGEDIPTGQSLRARAVLVELAHGRIDGNRLSRAQADARAGRYAAAMSGFLSWLAGRRDDQVAAFQARIDEIRRDESLTPLHARTVTNVSELVAASETFLQFAVHANALDEAQADSLRAQWRQALIEVGNAQIEHQEPLDLARRFVNLISSALTTGEAHVLDDGERWEDNLPTAARFSWLLNWRAEDQAPPGDHIGWVGLARGDLLLDREAAFRVVNRLAREEGQPLSVSPAAVLRALRDRGLLVTVDVRGGARRFDVRRVIHRVRRPVLHLRAHDVVPGRSEVDESGGPSGPSGQVG